MGRGDNDYSDRNGKCLFEYAKNASLDVQFADYHNIRKLVDFVNENLNVMFFFPHTFWNTYCEMNFLHIIIKYKGQILQAIWVFFLSLGMSYVLILFILFRNG